MKTTNFPHARVLVLGMLTACQLPPDLLEVGDEDSESVGGTSEAGTSETTDTGEPEPLVAECVEQGGDLWGDPQPELDFSLPDCEVVCAEGWGHGVPRLESEWTYGAFSTPTTPVTRGAMAIRPEGWLTAVFSGPEQSCWMLKIRPEGNELTGTNAVEGAIEGEVLDFGIDSDGVHYFLWTDGAMQRLVALEWSTGIHVIFELELGPHHELNSVFDVLDDGVIIALDDGITRLLRINQAGDILFEHVIPTTSAIDVAPSGDVVALANFTTINWADADGNYLGSHEIDQVTALYGLVATDDTHVVFAGGEPDSGGMRGFLHELGEMGPGWSRSYDRADAWCGASATQERFTDVDQLADGTLVVTGVESLGHPYGDDIVDWSQPWIAHVSAEGEVLAYDRGLWLGRALDVVAHGDVAYVLLTKKNDYDTFGSPYVRKYAF